MAPTTTGSATPGLSSRLSIRSLGDMAMRLTKRKECTSSSSGDTCEKPGGGANMALPIALGVIIPLAVALAVLVYLHRRNVRRQRAEDAKDPLKDMDFGVDPTAMPMAKGSKRKSLFGGEKLAMHKGQLSMDMNLSSPYLLPPGNHSKDSLAQGFPDSHDPYRMVASETGSIRSFGPGEKGSMYGGSSRHTSVAGRSVHSKFPPPPRQNSNPPRSPATPSSRTDPFATPPPRPEPAHQAYQVAKEEEIRESQLPQPIVPEIGQVTPFPEDNVAGLHMPSVRSPPPTMAKDPQDRVASPPMSPPHAQSDFPLPPSQSQNNQRDMSYPGEDFIMPTSQEHQGFDLDLPKPLSPPVGIAVEHHDKHNMHDQQPHIQAPAHYDDDQDVGRGRERMSRYDMHEAQTQQQEGGLGVPQQDNKRLSVGFRPLPPAEELESDDPEFRANRIRSFYKEYFEDPSSSAPPVPAVPEYYEDYDQGYLGDAAYYDADTNAFVMPYAQPVTRRAMTPPPAGRRPGPGGPGPRGPGGPRPRGPHGPHGSLGGMSLPGGPGGRSRAGSAYGPRPDSSASARMGRGTPRPKKNLPPPSALNTLPTPGKLKDDSFAIINAADFAPPDSYQDRNRGRSQSPLGERRAFSPQVPVASPLNSAFDEMASLPSPHLLRKSNTFTGLDFAPPKKFKNEDTMSDAGSIRSNRSGISSAGLSAVRGGAGRVSRLPGDQVFTAAALDNTLKPSWTMRP